MSEATERQVVSSRLSNRRFFAALVIVAFLITGGISFYASSHPDGLEYVAARTGFESSASEHAVAGGPLADYGVKGIANERLSGGLAGVLGVAITLGVAGGVTWLVRRRTPGNGTPEFAASDGDAVDVNANGQA